MVSVLLKGVPKYVELERLGSYLHKLFDTDEIGSFRLKELPRSSRNKRQLSVDFSSGFDAMAAQDILDGHRYEPENGVRHKLKAKVLPSSRPISQDYSTKVEFDEALADFHCLSQQIAKSKKKKSNLDKSSSDSDSSSSPRRKSRKRSRQNKHNADSHSSRSRSRSLDRSVSPKKRAKSESWKSNDKSRQSSKQPSQTVSSGRRPAKGSPSSGQWRERSRQKSQVEVYKDPRASSARPYNKDHYDVGERDRGESSSRYNERGRHDDREYERGYHRGDRTKYHNKGYYASRESGGSSKYYKKEPYYDRGYERGESSSRYTERGHYSQREEGENLSEDKVTRININISPKKSTGKTKENDTSEEGEISSDEETTKIVIKINPKKTTPKIKQDIKIEPDPFNINDWVTIKQEITQLEEQVKMNKGISQNPRFVIPIQKVLKQMKRYRTNRISDEMLSKFISVSKAELLIRFRKVMADQSEYMPSAAIFALYRQHYSREEDAEFVENLIREFAEGKYDSWIDSDEEKENRKKNRTMTKETNDCYTIVKTEPTDNDNAQANKNKDDMETDIKNINIKNEPDVPDELLTMLCNEIDMGLSDVITDEMNAEEVNTLNKSKNEAEKLNLNEQIVEIKPDPDANTTNTEVKNTHIQTPVITTIKQEPQEFDAGMMNVNETMNVDIKQNIVPKNNEQSIDKSSENINNINTSDIVEDSALQKLISECPSDVKPPMKKECEETIETIEKFVDFITNVNEVD